MAKKVVRPSEKPTFDYGRVGSEWREAFQENMSAVSEATFTIQRQPHLREPIEPDDDADEEAIDRYNAALDKYDAAMQAFYEKRDAAMTLIKESPTTQKQLMAQVLVDVPRAWLLDDAPADIDWSNPDNLKFVSYDGYGKLLSIWIQGGGARAKAKN